MPNILTASLRDNIDPNNLYTDSEILQIFEKVGLGQLVMKLKLNIHTIIDSSTFSIAENQLICLARVLLKKYFNKKIRIKNKNKKNCV